MKPDQICLDGEDSIFAKCSNEIREVLALVSSSSQLDSIRSKEQNLPTKFFDQYYRKLNVHVIGSLLR